MLQIKNTLGGGKPNAPYAWAKYNTIENPIYYINPSFTAKVITAGSVFEIVTSSFDASKVDTSFFEGFEFDVNTVNLSVYKENEKYYISKGGSLSSPREFTYDPTTMRFNINNLSDSIGTKLPLNGGNYTGNKPTGEYEIVADSLIEYIIDDSPNKYPNGEVHTDGFFYRYAPEGLYAWKKYEYTNGIYLTNPKITSAYISSTTKELTGSNFNLSDVFEALGISAGTYSYTTNEYKALAKFLDGMNDGTFGLVNGWYGYENYLCYVFNITNTNSGIRNIASIQVNSNSITISYDNADITSGTSNKYFTYTGEKVVIEQGKCDFIDYIVSNKETAYPDGGEKGGYWYERVIDGISPEMFGCTKCETGTFTVSSNTYKSPEISHSLGVIPRFAIVWRTTPAANADKSFIYSVAYAIAQNSGGGKYGFGEIYASGAVNYSNGYNGTTSTSYFTSTKVIFDASPYSSNAYTYFKSGETYNYVLLG